MPLLIGPLAGVVLLALSCACAPALAQSPEPPTGEGVVAPQAASGEPTTTENSSDQGAGPRSSGPEAPGTPEEPLAVTLGFLGVHVVWGCLAGLWLWKRRATLFVPADEGAPPVFARGVGWVLLLGALVVWFGMATGAGSAQVLFKIGTEEYQTLRGMVLVNAGGYVGGLAALAFLSTMLWPLRGALGRRPRATDALRGLGAYVIAHPFIWLSGWLATRIAEAIGGAGSVDPLAHDTLRALSEEPVGRWWIGAVLIAVIGAPILEEIIYRGMIQNGLLRLTRSPGAAIGVSAFIFAFMHTSSVAPYALPILFVLGLAFGMAYNRTGRLLVSIVMHAAFNAMNLAVLLLVG